MSCRRALSRQVRARRRGGTIARTGELKRQHEPQRFVGDLLTAEISEKQARSIKYQITIAKLPRANGGPTSDPTAEDNKDILR